ncbi:redoxin domain-containing protein [uncultured Pseudodesulfovibrio sp.]|uniref:TlpA family protein disulfide reductase n=1 Tax=uncultured Pseudodesulfovibrio sp. TaxID=2035858 RepID=UPI0029C64740|nr:redoxin domain-containing protein [uncultured Pseudodesulfovibrio sp.]
MQRTRTIILTICALFTLTSAALAGTPFPDVDLKGQLTAEQKEYLGVTTDTFKVSDIKADYLFVEAFSMYCPICQRDAPKINELYDIISKMDTAKSIKFIGLATGNTGFETAFYQKKYDVRFPLFEDADYVIHGALDEIGTPSFYVVKKTGSTLETLFFKEGEAKDKDVLLQAIKQATGLK